MTILSGQLAGLVYFLSTFLYIRAILRGGVRPHRTTWCILTVVAILTAGSYYATGARHSMWMPVADIVLTSIVVVLAVRYGEGGWSKFDRGFAVLAIAGVVLWTATSSPILALLVFLGIDFAGLLPTFRKSAIDPQSEDSTAWLLTFVASLLNMFAVNAWELGIVLYPLYMLIVNGAIALLVARPAIERFLARWMSR